VSPAHEAAVRRFSLVWGTSLAVKLLALAVFLYVAVRLAGGSP
jgi:hypothetical protein